MLPFLKSVLAGFLVAMPIGAIGILCIRRTLEGKWYRALSLGAGAALADCLLAAGAILGLSLITQYLHHHQGLLQLAGGVFLVVFGAHSLSHHRQMLQINNGKDAQNVNSKEIPAIAASISTGLALTIVNPATFFAFVGIFAALDFHSIVRSGSNFDFIIIFGVFIGSFVWWISLIAIATILRYLLPSKITNAVDAVLGLSLIALGMVALVLT